MRALGGFVVLIIEHLENVLSQRLFDFLMAWDSWQTPVVGF